MGGKFALNFSNLILVLEFDDYNKNFFFIKKKVINFFSHNLELFCHFSDFNCFTDERTSRNASEDFVRQMSLSRHFKGLWSKNFFFNFSLFLRDEKAKTLDSSLKSSGQVYFWVPDQKETKLIKLFQFLKCSFPEVNFRIVRI